MPLMAYRRWIAFAGVIWMLAQDVLAQPTPEVDSAARAAFVAALGADGAESVPAASADGTELRNYVLYPYLQAIRLERALATAVGPWGPLDARARQLIEAAPGEPLAQEVREAWLRSLARREQWQGFVDQYRPAQADQALRCAWLGARHALGEERSLFDAARDVWLTGHRLPPACEPVFQWLASSGHLGPDLIERRVRLLLENGEAGFARAIASRLPGARAAPLLRWAQLIERPEPAFDELIETRNREVEPGIVFDAWTRFARADPNAAEQRYRRLVRALNLDATERGRYALELALGLSWDRQARSALEYFDLAKETDDYALTWEVRAALWQGDWARVLSRIAAMSPVQRQATRWRYWAGRASDALGISSAARSFYESVLDDDNFYSAMAAARLGRPAVPHLEILSLDEPVLEAVAERPAFRRARELFLVGLGVRAAAQWQYGYTLLDDSGRRQSVLLATRWGWYDMAVATATRQGIFNDYELLYPRPYASLVAAAAERNGLAAPLLYGLIRQESLFRADAGSAAGAVGLMQLTPETARRVARGTGVEPPQRGDLVVPEISIALGAAHLKSLIDEFDGQLFVALAGYNAGPRAAERWLPAEPLDADIWLENIPYNETRDYVQRVLWHRVVFAWLSSGEAQGTQSWLAAVRRPDAP